MQEDASRHRGERSARHRIMQRDKPATRPVNQENNPVNQLRPVRLIVIACVGMIVFASSPVCSQARAQTASQRQQFAKAIRNAATRVLPSVVSVEVIGVAQGGAGSNSSEVANDAPSCGLVVDPSGLILASDIILRRPSASLLVVLDDQTRLAATVVARDYHRGLVLLKTEADRSLPAIEVPSEVRTPVGGTVVAVGRYGTDQSPMVSSGILSARGRLEGTMLQTDARVSPTYYGGPLVDLYGNVIGIVVPAVAPGGAPDDTSWYDSGIAFAVPLPIVANKLPQLRDGKDIKKGLIGIVPRSNDPYEEDTQLAAVRSRSPAEKAGLQAGDVIESVAGQTVLMFQQVKEALGPYDAGDEIEIKYQRDGQSSTINVTLADSIPPLRPQRIGAWAVETDTALTEASEPTATKDTTDDDRITEDAPGVQVVVAGVLPGSPSDGKLVEGDVIESVNDAAIESLATLRRKLVTAEPDVEIEIRVRRDDSEEIVSVMPTSVAGALPTTTFPAWKANNESESDDPWDVKELRLPDVPNLGAYAGPENDQSVDGLALLVLLLSPEQRDPQDALKDYRKAATENGVLVCAICSEDDQRWQPKEIDTISRMTTLMAQRIPVGAIGIAATGAIKGNKPSAADSMVIAMALSDRKNFDGIAVSDQTRPPAVRLRENEPDRSLQLLLPIENVDDGPTWLAPLSKAGYPVTLGGELQFDDLLRWTRLLQSI